MPSRGFWALLVNLSTIVWGLSVAVVVGILALATKFATREPDFSTGDPEHGYLLPMLTFFFTGLISFIVMLVSKVITLFTKGDRKKTIPILTPRNVILFVSFILFGSISFLFGLRQANVGSYSQEAGAIVTGEEVFNATNEYRKSQGLGVVAQDPYLCNNLVQRYLDIVNPDNKFIGHPGFQKWAEEQGLNGYELSEVYVTGIRSGSEAVKFWLGSPGHKKAIEGDFEHGCAYANNGVAVMVLGNKL